MTFATGAVVVPATTIVVGEGSFLALLVLASSRTAGLTLVVVVGVPIGSGVRPSFGFREHRRTSFGSTIPVRLSCYCRSGAVITIKLRHPEPGVIIEC